MELDALYLSASDQQPPRWLHVEPLPWPLGQHPGATASRIMAIGMLHLSKTSKTQLGGKHASLQVPWMLSHGNKVNHFEYWIWMNMTTMLQKHVRTTCTTYIIMMSYVQYTPLQLYAFWSFGSLLLVLCLDWDIAMDNGQVWVSSWDPSNGQNISTRCKGVQTPGREELCFLIWMLSKTDIHHSDHSQHCNLPSPCFLMVSYLLEPFIFHSPWLQSKMPFQIRYFICRNLY